MSGYTTRPLRDRTWLRPADKREASRFSSSWGDTETLLVSEVAALRGRDLVIEVDVTEAERAALLAAVAVLSGRSDVTDLTKRWGERS